MCIVDFNHSFFFGHMDLFTIIQGKHPCTFTSLWP